jgi:hypothetical protein
MSTGDEVVSDDGYGASCAMFGTVVAFLDSEEAASLEHAELEDQLAQRSRELFCCLFQDHLDRRAQREPRLEGVADAEGVGRPSVEAGHHRQLATIFGDVDVERLAYRCRGRANLHPADAALNLPAERYSHGLRRLAAIEASRGSFGDAVDAIARATGQHVGKRQVEELTRRAAVDIDDFYTAISREPAGDGDMLVISVDGKGIVMRPDSLRPATEKAAARATTKLKTRLSKGEQPNRKRLATVGAVYDTTPVPRQPTDVLASKAGDNPPPAPKAKAKWMTASVADSAAHVVGAVFDEAQRRDPHHRRRWVALVDGNQHQIDRLHAEAEQRGVEITIVVDLIHVLEYLWGAAWCFFSEADPAAETWMHERALAVLGGHATNVAAGIRRRATAARLSPSKRRKADLCAAYLANKAPYLNYPTALAAGWPIATGVIEGACRHLVKDRMDITGARWGLDGAEAVLELRALRTNRDFDTYWHFHLRQERHRLHENRYLNRAIPRAA